MNKMKLSEKQLKQIKGWIEEARIRLLMYDWTINTKIDNSMEGVMMKCDPDRTYMNAMIAMSEAEVLKDWKLYGDKYMRCVCFHEVLHAFMAPFVDMAFARHISFGHLDEEKERLTERLAKIISGHVK